jgi:hypothetical protein
MNQNTQERMIRVANEHGFVATVRHDGGVNIEIPFSRRDHSVGMVIESAYTVSEVYRSLGY